MILDAKIGSSSARLDSKIDSLAADTNARFDGVNARFDGMNARFDQMSAETNARFDTMRNWAIGLYLALAAGMFSLVARAFGWV